MAFQPDLHAKSAHENMIEKLQQDNQNYHVHTWKQLFCCQFKWLKTASINWCQTIMKPAISSTCPHSVELCVPLRDHFLIGSSHGTSRQSQPTRYHRPNHKILQRDTINRPGISSVLQRNLTGTKALEFKNMILKKIWDFNWYPGSPQKFINFASNIRYGCLTALHWVTYLIPDLRNINIPNT